MASGSLTTAACLNARRLVTMGFSKCATVQASSGLLRRTLSKLRKLKGLACGAGAGGRNPAGRSSTKDLPSGGRTAGNSGLTEHRRGSSLAAAGGGGGQCNILAAANLLLPFG